MREVLHPSFKAMPHVEGLGTHNATSAPEKRWPKCPVCGSTTSQCPRYPCVDPLRQSDQKKIASLDADLLAKVAAIKARETAE